MGQGDETLMQLFANEETEQAQQAQEQQAQSQQKQAGVRTASTRTVGTRPTAGVARLGGAAGAASSNDTNRLSSLWATAPDVKDVFGLK
jgi:hypothetical protein